MQLRLALARQTELLPALAARVAEWQVPPRQDPAAAKEDVVALATLGAVAASLNHNEVMADV